MSKIKDKLLNDIQDFLNLLERFEHVKNRTRLIYVDVDKSYVKIR